MGPNDLLRVVQNCSIAYIYIYINIVYIYISLDGTIENVCFSLQIEDLGAWKFARKMQPNIYNTRIQGLFCLSGLSSQGKSNLPFISNRRRASI